MPRYAHVLYAGYRGAFERCYHFFNEIIIRISTQICYVDILKKLIEWFLLYNYSL